MNTLLSTLDLWRCTSFLAGLIVLWIVTGILKERQILHDADSRKINHVAVFSGGALLFGWLPEASARANLYVICSVVLILIGMVCYYRQTIPFSYAYTANTRQSDAPHGTFFFCFSWFVSIVALAIVDVLFGQMAVTRVAVLVVGIADGVAEPIGRRWGWHRYPVLSWRSGPSFRSIEGSMAVWVATLVVMLCCSTPMASALGRWITAALLTASITTVVEATSPRGWDNFTLLLVVAGLTDLFLLVQWIG